MYDSSLVLENPSGPRRGWCSGWLVCLWLWIVLDQLCGELLQRWSPLNHWVAWIACKVFAEAVYESESRFVDLRKGHGGRLWW